jgi:hypothetical protein
LLFGQRAHCLAQSVDAPRGDAPRMNVLTDDQWRRIDVSVDRALAWLAGQQGRDGSFPTNVYGNPGVTSLCVLAMLSSHHLPDGGQYGEALSRAIDYILATQKPNGLIAVQGPAGQIDARGRDGNVSSSAPYNHAISALALSEVYAMTNDRRAEDIRAAIERAIAFSLQFQQRPKYRPVDIGGWRYLDRNAEMESDLSITGWYLMSLRSAKNAGFDVPQEAIDSAVGYVTRCFNEREGTFYYGLRSNRVRSRAMAAAGILALAHAGEHHTPMALRAGDWIRNNAYRGYNEIRFEKDTFHYGAFYCSQAMYQLGGNYWADFFPHTAMLLVDNQQSDGGWPPDSSGEGNYGRTYSTALTVLALSAPNQVLPVFQR